jgi:RNA polymerase sigma factor for flagellar operon FliA
MATLSQPRQAGDAVQELWEQYWETGEGRLKDRLVLTLAPLVKYIVYRKVREIPARCEVDDYISVGIEAVIKSIDRYDPERGTTLQQFVWTRIHGAVLDELRRGDWAPRSLRRWERDMSQASERFTALYGRRPTRAELADALAVTPEELDRRRRDIARSDVGSLNVLVLGDDEMAIERIDTLQSSDPDGDPELAATREDAVDRFRAAFEQLPARDRVVAVLLYVENLTLREIGQVLGVSESRVCQIHGRLKKTLRRRLEADEELFLEVA